MKTSLNKLIYIRTILVCAAISLSACGSYIDPAAFDYGAPFEAITLQSAPLPSSDTTNPIIIVMWTGYTGPSRVPVIIYESDIKRGALAPGGAIIWETSPGQKQIHGRYGRSKECYGPDEKCTYSEEMLLAPGNSYSRPYTAMTLKTEANKIYYVEIDASASGRNRFKSITAEEAQHIKLFGPYKLNFTKFSGLHHDATQE